MTSPAKPKATLKRKVARLFRGRAAVKAEPSKPIKPPKPPPPPPPPPGWTRVREEPGWRGFDLNGFGAFAVIAGRLTTVEAAPIEPQTVIVRVRVLNAAGGALDDGLTGLRNSQKIGRYFYPGEVLEGEDWRFGLKLPAGAARLELAVQHHRRGDATRYFQRDLDVEKADRIANPRLTAAVQRAAGERAERASTELRRALKAHAAALAGRPGPLHADEDPFGEPLAQYYVQAEGDAALGERLALRRLKAGRDLEALSLLDLTRHPALIRALGRRRLHEATADITPPATPPPIKARSLVYLLHNSLPFDSGGYAARAHGLLRGFQAAGWTVHAFTRPGYPEDRGKVSDADRHEIDGVTYHRLPGDQSIDDADQAAYVDHFAERVLEALEGQEVGLIQAASFFQNAFAGRIVADRLGVPLIYEMRGMDWLTRGSEDPRWFSSDQARVARDLELWAAKAADRVMAITPALKDWLVEAGVPAERVGVLRNGASPDQFAPRPRDDALAERLGLSSAFVVAYVGSVAPYEGVGDIIAAVAEARRRSGHDIRFLLVGDGRASLGVERTAADLGAEAFMAATGRVPHHEIAAYYSIADVVALARQDIPVCRIISPLKPLEALSMAKYVISTDVPAIRDILEPAQGDGLVPPGSVEAYADAIIHAAENAGDLAERGRRSRDWIVANRDWSILARAALDEAEAVFGGPD